MPEYLITKIGDF